MVLLFVPTDLLQFNKSFSLPCGTRASLRSQNQLKELFLAENSFIHASVHNVLHNNAKKENKNAQTVRSWRFIASVKGCFIEDFQKEDDLGGDDDRGISNLVWSENSVEIRVKEMRERFLCKVGFLFTLRLLVYVNLCSFDDEKRWSCWGSSVY